MKQVHQLRNEKPLKLPQIPSKTSSSFSIETNSNSRVRPSSSSKVNDLEKNLFSQLDQYNGLDKKSKKSKTKKEIEMLGEKELAADLISDAPYLKKLEKLLPETYMKLLNSKKVELLQENKKVQEKPQESQPQKIQKEAKKQSQNQNQKQEKRESSFDVAEREIEEIFEQYLKDEGLDKFPESNYQDLQELNKQIDSTSSEINEIQKNMYDIIRMFGDECVNMEE